jgi:hypothetical protein
MCPAERGEASKDLGVELAGLQVTQSRDDVEADDVLVPLAPHR